MGLVSVAAIVIFGTIGLGVVLGIAWLLTSALQSDSDRRRAARARRARRHDDSP